MQFIPNSNHVSDPDLSNKFSDECENGASNQLFVFDENQALISNQGDEINLELSAATKNKICTYCVTGSEAAQQVCYAESRLNFCASCGPILMAGRTLSAELRLVFKTDLNPILVKNGS